MNRRSFLMASGRMTGVSVGGLSALSLAGCARTKRVAVAVPAPLPFYDAVGPILPIRAHMDRIFRITVCLRPFRAAGPRLEMERVGEKTVAHNYGHGGSGWSLSWGSADVVVRKVLALGDSDRKIAVIGCGALGMTAAITAQRAGLQVTIYARERPPFVRSSNATGSWTPDSRVALKASASPAFAPQWEAMARTSFSMYQSYLGMAGNPIEWTDRYQLADTDREESAPQKQQTDTHEFVRYHDRIADLTPKGQDIPAGSHPFPTKYVRRTTSLTFNVADYSRQLMNDFLVAGGAIETREFHSPGDLAALPQRTVINCAGYGARQLWSDESIVPVRGQIAWLIPQEGVNYGLTYKDLNVLARRDGIVIQPSLQGEESGWNDSNEQPDRSEAEAGVLQLQELYGRIEKMRRETMRQTRGRG